MISKLVSMATSAVLVLSTVAVAQRSEVPVRPLPGRGSGRAAQQALGAGKNQQALVRQVRQAFAATVRRQLNLNDDQARRLQGVDQSYQLQRRQLRLDEQAATVGLTAAMSDTTVAVDQAKIGQYLDQLSQIQHRRANLVEAEQKEQSAFLTPLQRAKLLALRTQLNRRVTQLTQEGRGGTPPAVPPVPPLER